MFSSRAMSLMVTWLNFISARLISIFNKSNENQLNNELMKQTKIFINCFHLTVLIIPFRSKSNKK